ncbi:MAG: VWA domain-containing protein [Sandaracinaceae bacterium]|nr:VWA domain-containing protein [Sandaracinaceae bacterium]
MIRLAAPWMLAIGAPLVLLVLWRVRHLPAAHRGLTRRAVQVSLLLAALFAALALARLEVGRAVDRLAVIFLVDRSLSVEGAADPIAAAQGAIEGMRADDLAGLVAFGAIAATEVSPAPRPSFGVVRAPIPRDATDLGAAIRRGLADLPGDHVARLVLVSDGVETRGDALAAAAVAAGRGVPIDVLAIERAPRPEIAIERVRLPPVADPGQPLELRVVTRATDAARVRVVVRRDGEPIAQGETEIRAGADVLTLREVAPSPGVHRYEVLLEPLDAGADATPENNEGAALIRVAGGSRALVLAERPPEAAALAQALSGAGVEVAVGGVERVPADLAELATYDLVVLSDVGARAFTEGQMSALAAYVRDLGGGLLMAGARDAFGLGGYSQTPIEEVLPATFDLRRRRDRASLAMVIAIDKSGSMGVEVSPGRTKLDLANEAAARSAMLLSPLDRVAVAHVDTEVDWTLSMTPVEDPQRIAARIRAAGPGGGGILVDLTLRASYDVLEGQPTQLKHLLLFSDGYDSEEMTNARALVSGAARRRITTSIVSMGNGPDTPELERLSHLGGGRFYIVEDMTELPRIFTQETIAASRAALVDEAFRVRVGEPSAVTRGIDFASAPALGGHAVVNVRPRASVLLGATEDDPLLAVHQHGVGQSAVFTTDAGAAWGRPWLAWPGYAALFGQLGRSLARSPERRDAQIAVTLDGGRGQIRVEAVDELGRVRNYLDLSATIAGPGGRSSEVALTETASGRYEASFDADAPGPYLVTVRERGEGLVGSAGVVRARGDELRGDGTDHARLAQIAALSGGRVREGSLARVFAERPPPIHAFTPLWRELVALAMILLLLSVALRRLVLPRRLAWRAASAASAASAADEPAPSVAIARAAAPAALAPAAAAEDARDEAPEADPPPPDDARPAAPDTLAETLLARKRRKR